MPEEFRPYPIADIRYGKFLARKPWLAPSDAFQNILNAYVDRGILKKRKGFTEWGWIPMAVEDEQIGVGDIDGTFEFTATMSHFPLQAGSITVVSHTDAHGDETFTDNGDGTLTSDKASARGTGTYTAATGQISVEFEYPPDNGEPVLCSYSYPAGLPVMGISEHFTATGRYLHAFNTKRMAKYNPTTGLLEDVTGSDTWTGQDDDFFHTCSATDDKFYITNNVDQIRTWDGTTLAAFVIDYTGGSTNKVNTCKFIFEYHGHLVILAPTEENTYRGRRYRCSAAGTFTSWPSYTWADAPTPDEIQGAQMIGGVLYVWFKESLWRLVYTGIYTLPFEWEEVSPEEGLYAPFSPVTVGGKSYGIGKSAVLCTDSAQVFEVDEIVQDEVDDQYDKGKVSYVYGARLRELRQIWWTFCSVGAAYPDRVLAYDYRNGNFFPYNLAFMCFGSFTAGSTVTLDDVEEAFDDLEDNFDSARNVAGYPIKLAGTHDGYIMQCNNGVTDNGQPIEFSFETMELNPFVKSGLTATLGWVDFLLTPDEVTELTLNFYVDQEETAYLAKTLDFEDAKLRRMVWKRVDVGCLGASHRFKGFHTKAGQPVEIHAMVPWFRPEGPISGY